MSPPPLPLDRVTPTQRPSGSNQGTQRWRDLFFLHWTVPIEAVRPLIPSALELDPWDGRMHIGVVPLRMEQIRPSWIPRAAGLDFLELNLRTYVHHRGRPGIWFFSLEASSWLAVRAARASWSLPYHHARMDMDRGGGRLRYASERRGAAAASWDAELSVGAPLGSSELGTIEHFLFERYLLFAERGGRVLEGAVNHQPYAAHRAEVHGLRHSLSAAAGLPHLDEPPSLVHYCPGVDVEVFGPTPR
jgi:uncharacterized protein YqjF (DUF2071 family)